MTKTKFEVEHEKIPPHGKELSWFNPGAGIMVGVCASIVATIIALLQPGSEQLDNIVVTALIWAVGFSSIYVTIGLTETAYHSDESDSYWKNWWLTTIATMLTPVVIAFLVYLVLIIIGIILGVIIVIIIFGGLAASLE